MATDDNSSHALKAMSQANIHALALTGSKHPRQAL